MKTKQVTAIMIQLLWFSMLIFFPMISSAKRLGDRTYELTGIVTKVDERFNTVVVECRGEDQTVTVGGPVSSQAVLEKEGIGVGLGDFYVGEKVIVRWRVTKKTHVIMMLKGGKL